MGLAHYAPMDHYKRHFGVLDIAIQKMREFLQNKNHELGFRNSEDIGNEIDRATHDNIESGFFETFNDGNQPAKLVNLKETIFDGLYAILHKDKPSKVKRHEWCVVTFLTPDLVAKNKANPNWKWDHQDLPGKGMVSMRSKLAPMMENLVSEAGKKVEEKPELPKQVQVPIPPTVQTSQAHTELRLVTWLDDNDLPQSRLCMSPKEAAEVVASLIEDIAPEDIQVLRPQWVEAKKKVKIEIE